MLGYITLITIFIFSFLFFGFLAQLLDAECIVPLVVAISGRVGSENPITCELSGLRGVVVEETVILQTNHMHLLFYFKATYIFLFLGSVAFSSVG